MNCIALDDEPLALEIIAAFCARIPNIKLVKTFTKTSEASAYLSKSKIDLLFLDIQMPDMTGIDFHKTLSPETMVIFTTAFSEYALQGFELNAIDYLLKPFQFARFERAVQKAFEYYTYVRKNNSQDERYLFVKADYSLIKIDLNDILYIETMDDYIKIHLPGKKPILTLMTMKSMLEKLPGDSFIRVHRSFIVPLHRIESVRGKTINVGITEIPIGASYEAPFFAAYTKKGFY